MRNESLFWLLRDARRARKRGPEAIVQRQRTRLAELVAYARAQSPYFCELYKDLPDRVEDVRLLPVTDKRRMMAHYDEWVTDRAVTVEKVRAFISDRDLIGERFLDKYTALTTSGTTGTPGIFLWDDHSMTVTYVLALRMLGAWLRVRDVVRIVTSGGRVSLVCATGGHYAEAVADARLRTRRGDTAVQVLAAQAPIGEIVAQLNRFRPAVLALRKRWCAARERAGRWPAAYQPGTGRALRRRTSGRRVRADCESVRHQNPPQLRCDGVPVHQLQLRRWMVHVNSDWVVLEPVDADGRPTSPGTQSHTVLISNLANRVQPILRYDLGDRMLQRPDPCPCGSRLPAIRVEGRTADMLTFFTERGEQVAIPALMFEVVDTMGVARFQIVQATPARLRVRLESAAGADPNRVCQAVHAEIARVLEQHGLRDVTVERAEEPPAQSPGGKYRAVIPLTSAST